MNSENTGGKLQTFDLNRLPFGAPPDFTPKKTPDLYKTEPWEIRGCRGGFAYIWLKDGRSFWVYITNAGRNHLSGFRWNRFGWTFFGISLKNVESFYCGIK